MVFERVGGATIGGLLMNPIFLVVIAIIFLVLAFSGLAVCLFAPELLAAAALGLIGIVIMVWAPAPLWVRFVIGIAMILIAIVIYLKPEMFNLSVDFIGACVQ